MYLGDILFCLVYMNLSVVNSALCKSNAISSKHTFQEKNKNKSHVLHCLIPSMMDQNFKTILGKQVLLNITAIIFRSCH